MKVIKIILVLLLFLVALALGAQNQEMVTFNYLIAKGEFHLSWLLGSIFIAGFVVSWLIFGSLYLRAKMKVRRLTKQIEKESTQKLSVNKKAPKENLNIG
jgi:lipopolysaccharide assembly protein A